MSAIALSVGLAAGSLAVAAAGTGYSIYNSEQQKKAGRGGGGMDKKQKEYLNQIANETLAKQQANIDQYKRDAKAAGKAYKAAGLGLSNEYNTRTKETIADYDTGNLNLEARSTENANALAERSKTIGEDTANQALAYNTSKMQDYIAFADALSLANSNSAQRMLFANSPELEKQQQQALLLSGQQMSGMLSSGTQALLSRRAAQMGGASGTGFGSQLRNNFELRDLGLTAEDQAQKGLTNYRALRSDIYDQTVAGRQVGADKIMDFMGLNTDKLLTVNQANNLAQYTAGQNTIDIRQTGLRDILTTRSRANEVDYTQKMGMENNIYGGTLDYLGRSADLGYKSFSDWGNLRSGGVIQSWANENSRAASNATLNAANNKAIADTSASTAAMGLDFYKDYKSGAYNSNVVGNGGQTYTSSPGSGYYTPVGGGTVK